MSTEPTPTDPDTAEPELVTLTELELELEALDRATLEAAALADGAELAAHYE